LFLRDEEGKLTKTKIDPNKISIADAISIVMDHSSRGESLSTALKRLDLNTINVSLCAGQNPQESFNYNDFCKIIYALTDWQISFPLDEEFGPLAARAKRLNPERFENLELITAEAALIFLCDYAKNNLGYMDVDFNRVAGVDISMIRLGHQKTCRTGVLWAATIYFMRLPDCDIPTASAQSNPSVFLSRIAKHKTGRKIKDWLDSFNMKIIDDYFETHKPNRQWTGKKKNAGVAPAVAVKMMSISEQIAAEMSKRDFDGLKEKIRPKLLQNPNRNITLPPTP